MILIQELRAGSALLGKLYRLDNGRLVVELRCRGRGCDPLVCFDVETGLPVAVDGETSSAVEDSVKRGEGLANGGRAG